MADHQCTSATSVHRSSLFPFVLGFALLITMTWLYHVLGPRLMVCAVSASRHPRFGTCCHLISRTVVLVANSSSRALRLGSLFKPLRTLFNRRFTNTKFDWLNDWLTRTRQSNCRRCKKRTHPPCSAIHLAMFSVKTKRTTKPTTLEKKPRMPRWMTVTAMRYPKHSNVNTRPHVIRPSRNNLHARNAEQSIIRYCVNEAIFAKQTSVCDVRRAASDVISIDTVSVSRQNTDGGLGIGTSQAVAWRAKFRRSFEVSSSEFVYIT